MITQCVNPACQAPFSHAREGRIITVERVLTAMAGRGAERPSEQYWLCGACCRVLKLVVEDGQVTTAPIETETAALAG